MSLGNPYIVDRPLSKGDPVIVRYKLQARIVQWLRRGQHPILVYGSARMGKTTFLQQLASELSPEFTVVKVDLKWPESGDADTAMQELQAQVAERLSTVLGQPEAAAEGAAERPRSEAEGAAERLGTDVIPALNAPPDRQVAVLVDGPSITDLNREAGIQWLQWLHSMPKVHFVVTVNGSSAEQYAERAMNRATTMASLPWIELEGLTLEESEELLLKPVRGRMAYNFDAVRRIWQLTSGHPYLVQLFGHVLFLAHSGRGRVEIQEVEKVVQEVVAASHAMMTGIWRACSPQTQVALAVSNELRGRHGVFTVRELQGAARLQGLELSAPAIEAGLSELLALGVLRRLSADSYTLYSEVFRLWLARYEPLSQTLAHLQSQKQLFAPRGPRLWRSLRWSTVAGWLVGLALLAVIVVLWNRRGSAERLVIGSSPTATPPVFTADKTLVVGPALGRIAYMAKEKPDSTWDIWVMRGDGSDPKRLTDDPANDMSPTWSPDGKYIAFTSDRDGNKEIYVMKEDGTQQLNLTHHSSEDGTPAWSPDGSAIAFSSYRDGNWEIYVMDVDGSHPQRLTRNNAVDLAPNWSPDSKRIVFNSNRDGNWNLYVMNRDGTGLQRLTVDEATDSAPAWSPDGTMIAFESYRDGDMEIYLLPVPPLLRLEDTSQEASVAQGETEAAPQNLSNDRYSNEHGPAWARNGTRLLYYSNRDGGWDIFSMKPDGTEKSNLTLSPALEQSPVWHE